MMDSQIKKNLIGLICLFLAHIFFGTTFSCNKMAIQFQVHPILLAFHRMWIAAVFLFPFYWRYRRNIHWSKQGWLRVIGIGAGAGAGAMILEISGTKFTTASNVSLISSTESIVSILLSVLILKERLQTGVIAGGICALAGMGLVLSHDIRTAEWHFNAGLLGDVLVFGAVFSWSLYTVYSKKIVEGADPICAIFWVSLFAALSLGLVNVFIGTITGIGDMSFSAWQVTVYLGIVGSGLAHLLYFQALKNLPATIVSITLTLLPVFGVAFSMGLLGEKLTLTQTIGAITIVTGVGYAVWPRSQPAAYPPEPQS